jgi:hypothetical protein
LAGPLSRQRTKAFLFATSRLAAFGLSVGAEMTAEVLLDPCFVDRFVLVATKDLAPASRRTLRTNLEAIRHLVVPASGPERVELARHHAKSGYSIGEIDAYVANALAQPTEGRRMRAAGLIALGAGAGLTGSDLRAVRGSDLVERSGRVDRRSRGVTSADRPSAGSLPRPRDFVSCLRQGELHSRWSPRVAAERDWVTLVSDRVSRARTSRHRASPSDLVRRMCFSDRLGVVHGGCWGQLLAAAR